MLKKKLYQTWLFALSCFLLLAVLVPVQTAAADGITYPGGMLTAPPPPQDMTGRYVSTTIRSDGVVSPLGMLNPGDIYLNTGSVTIGTAGNGDIAMNGSTFAYSVVQQVGVRLTLQRWSGSYWSSVYVSSDKTSSNSVSVTLSTSSTALKGYYYRVVGTHWINHNGVNEQGTSYGDSWAYN
ncbi:MAG: hypothetical protein K0R57_3884 [Paenibacillaceae bacterium]|nr:hypothetical protein [Paenibacillaceae bacterium]